MYKRVYTIPADMNGVQTEMNDVQTSIHRSKGDERWSNVCTPFQLSWTVYTRVYTVPTS